MKILGTFFGGVVVALLFATIPARADVVVYYSFNSPPSVTADTGSAISSISFSSADSGVTSFPGGSTMNAQGGFPAGNAFSSNGWITDSAYMFTLDATGLSGIGISFWEQKSGTGPAAPTLDYSTNGGGTWTTFSGLTASNFPGDVHSFDLSSIVLLNGNASDVFRIHGSGAENKSQNSSYNIYDLQH